MCSSVLQPGGPAIYGRPDPWALWLLKLDKCRFSDSWSHNGHWDICFKGIYSWLSTFRRLMEHWALPLHPIPSKISIYKHTFRLVLESAWVIALKWENKTAINMPIVWQCDFRANNAHHKLTKLKTILVQRSQKLCTSQKAPTFVVGNTFIFITFHSELESIVPCIWKGN